MSIYKYIQSDSWVWKEIFGLSVFTMLHLSLLFSACMFTRILCISLANFIDISSFTCILTIMRNIRLEIVYHESHKTQKIHRILFYDSVKQKSIIYRIIFACFVCREILRTYNLEHIV